MKVQDLYTYPIKSLGGIRTTEAKVFERGFEFDRRWMLVDNSCRFITQRVEHGLALLQTEITGNSILVKHKVIPDLQISIPIGFHSDELISVSIWDDTVKAFTLSKYYDDWFSEVLKKPCRLVHVPESTTRLVDSRFAKNGENVSLADAFPFLLINQTSLNDLNNRLSEAVPMNRFRPNIVLAGTEPFAEDSWLEIQIGKVRFQVAKPCARCVLTTVNQDTGQKSKEPLAALSKYRSIEGKVLFGQNMIALNEGLIKVNDPVSIISYK